MTQKKSILILGDSTSMSVGVERKTYPFILAKDKIWPEGSKIINMSLPGLTACDALAGFTWLDKKIRSDIHTVIVYLGNCDGLATEVRKGKYQPWMRIYFSIRNFLGLNSKIIHLNNKLEFMRWNYSIDPLIESPEKPEDFLYNIKKIYFEAKSLGAELILIRPKANLYFPPGLGKGNFIYYKFINIFDIFRSKLEMPNLRLSKAYNHLEESNFQEAGNIYKNIIAHPNMGDADREIINLSLNNYGVIQANLGNYNEAIEIFEILLSEQGNRKEIIYFNLAQIYKMLGNNDKFSEYTFRSYEEDVNLYRVRRPFLNVIDELCENYRDICLVNMHDFINDNSFLDYCHLLPNGQEKLANKIKDILLPKLNGGTYSSQIENILLNPEVGLGNFTPFEKYFKFNSSLSQEEVQASLSMLIKSKNSSSVELSNINLVDKFDYYLRHPCFTDYKDIQMFPPVNSTDTGRFPEFYIIRYIFPFLRELDNNPSITFCFDKSPGLLRSSNDFTDLLVFANISIDQKVDIFSSWSEPKLIQLISKCESMLMENQLKGHQIYNRIKTIIYWYVRESLRFGTHSRISMLYDRITLEYIAEGLAVALLINSKLSLSFSSKIIKIVNKLHATLEVHENFSSQFMDLIFQGNFSNPKIPNLVGQYDLELLKIAKSGN